MRSILLAGAALAALLPDHAFAQAPVAATTTAAADDVIYVYGVRSAYRESNTSSVTRTDTVIEEIPQSIYVITRDVIDDQAMNGMDDLVRYVPGVTMAQGEGHRDAPVFRGNQTTSDFFVDGLRDDLQYLRDLYNVDRVDVIKGPSALVFGRGTGGGAINRVSKPADGSDVRAFTLRLGDQGQARVTGDFGTEIATGFAVRANAVVEDSTSFRDHLVIERVGLAPAARIEMSDRTRLDLYGEYFEDNRTVDRGVPSQNGRPWAGPIETYFGNPDISYSEIEVASIRGVLTHTLSPSLSFRGALSYGDYEKFYQNSYPGGAYDAGADTIAISAYNAGTTRQNLLTQADLIWEPVLGGMEHTVLIGIEAGQQDSENTRINTTGGVFSLADRGRTFVPDFNLAPARDNTNDLGLFAVLVQDQIALTDTLTAVAGLRFDRVELDFTNNLPGGQTFARTDEFLSLRLGLIWEVSPGVSLYGSWNRAYLPQSGEQFNSLDATLATLEPEEFENSEIGLRFQPHDQLLISLAAYRLDRTNTRAPGPVAGTTVITGSQRAEGLEVSVQGEIRDGWNVIGAMAFQSAEITSTTSAAPAGRDVQLVPDFSASLWNRIAMTDRLDLALGLVYQGEQFASVSNGVTLPDYLRVDAGLFYALNDRIDVQLNIQNLTDETYWYTAHNDNNITPGAPRTLTFGLSVDF